MAPSELPRLFELKVRQQRTERVEEPNEHGGMTRTTKVVAEWDERCRFSVLLDWAALQDLLRRAARNKTGRAQDGPLRIQVTQRTRVL